MEELPREFAIPGCTERYEVLGLSWGAEQGDGVRGSLGLTVLEKCQSESLRGGNLGIWLLPLSGCI